MSCVSRSSETEAPPTTTTTTSLVPFHPEDSLSEAEITLLDQMIESCDDLLEFTCAITLGDICYRFAKSKDDFAGGDKVVNVEGTNVIKTRKFICYLEDVVHMWEFDAILAAKYGEEYYSTLNPGFLSFRDKFNFQVSIRPLAKKSFYDLDGNENSHETTIRLRDISFQRFMDEYSWDSDMPDTIRLKLYRFVYDLALALESAITTVEPMNENVADRILSMQNMPEAERNCIDQGGISLTNSLLMSQNYVIPCIGNICKTKTDSIVCHFEGDIRESDRNDGIWDIDSDREIAIASVLWKAMKYICATGELNDRIAPDDSNDACRQAATSICQTTTNHYIAFTSISRHVSILSSCLLMVELSSLPYRNAIIRCLEQIKTILTATDAILIPDRACADASQKCTEFYRANEYRLRGTAGSLDLYYPSNDCEAYQQYYDYELIWKNVLSLCTIDQDSMPFSESACRNYIQRFCDSSIGDYYFYRSSGSGGSVRGRFGTYVGVRDPNEIIPALCNIISDSKVQISNSDNSSIKYLKLTIDETHNIVTRPIATEFGGIFAETIRDNYVSTDLSENNISLINVATRDCANNSLANTELDCAVKLWRSCFDLISSSAFSKTKYEWYYSEVNLAKNYVCATAWVAELGRMALALSYSFSNDYLAGNFNLFYEYIAGQIYRDSYSVFEIDELGNVSPKLSSIDHLAERGTPTVNAIILPLLSSVAQLIRPYICLPTDIQGALTQHIQWRSLSRHLCDS